MRETPLITARRSRGAHQLARKGWVVPLPNPWNSEYLNRRPRQPGSKVYRQGFGLSFQNRPSPLSLITSPSRFRPPSTRSTDFRAAAETGKAQTERDAILDSLLHRFKFAALIIRFERFSGDVSSGTKTRGGGGGGLGTTTQHRRVSPAPRLHIQRRFVRRFPPRSSPLERLPAGKIAVLHAARVA